MKRSGVVIDKRPVVDSGNWQISESSATWDTPGFTGKYTWSIPSSIPAGGANATLSVTSTDKSGGRYNGVISLDGGIPVEGGPARAEALADKNGGQASASDTASFQLVPGSICDSCIVSVTVHVQDGPKVTFQYKAAAPPCSVTARFSAEKGKFCNLGKLPVGKKTTVDRPEPGKTKNISPREIPPETYGLILEILAEQEGERLAAALGAKLGSAKGAHDAIHGCVLLTQSAFEEREFDEKEARITREGQVALFNACARLLLSQTPAAPNVRAAGSSCHATVIPLFKKGTNVTAKRRKKATAALKRKLQPSCKAKPKGLAASIKAGGKKATLNRLIGKNIGAPLASDVPANGGRVSVKWKALKR